MGKICSAKYFEQCITRKINKLDLRLALRGINVNLYQNQEQINKSSTQRRTKVSYNL